MPIPNFNPQDFSKNLAQQAMQVVPPDLNENQKKYIVNKVFQFCLVAGNHLNQDPNVTYNAEKASIISQFIGEWTFHKSIDLIRSGVNQNHWDNVMQQIAFTVFEVAKNTQDNNMDTQEAAALIEQEVVACYEKALRELARNGLIEENNIDEILTYSNIDQMAEEAKKNKPTKEDEERALKYASIALFLLSLTEERREKILASLPLEESHQIRNYMKIPNLDQKLDPGIANEFLINLTGRLTSMPKSKSPNKHVQAIKKLASNYQEEEISNVVSSERSKIKEFVDICLNHSSSQSETTEVSPHISKIIAGYLKYKLTASYQQ